MKTITLPTCLLLALFLDLGARAQGTAFTYQGRLQDAGEPANGTYDLRFTLFDAPTGGAPLGVPNDLPTVAVTGGLFQVVLDFGAAAFDGRERWLEVAVRASGEIVSHTDLAPRQPITAVPYAMRATTALQVSGTIPDGKLSSNVALRNSDNMFFGNQIVPNHNVAVGTDSLNARLTVGDPSPTLGPTSDTPGQGLLVSFLDRFALRVSEGLKSLNLDYYNDGWQGPALTVDRNKGCIGIGTTAPGVKLDVNGTTRTKVLSITGGADVAEPFAMSTDGISRGSVVVIDPEHPGQLKLSDRPYDKRVAGVVSGAGGVNPGLILSQHEMLEGGQNVALTGRVYVLADPVNGPIEPGDLLTTAAAPGHAMKVTDHTQAQGAILGKAMSRLESGRGLVLMLVTLQ